MSTRIHKYISGGVGKYLPEFVYGSIDGTVTTFAIIAGIAGANLDVAIIVILGFSNVLADGFSMASSNYLAERAYQDQTGGKEKGKYPLKMAIVTFISFLVVGSIPVLSYLLAYAVPMFQYNAFGFSAVCTGIAFLVIGAIRGWVTKKHPARAALETVIIGAIAAGLAYIVGATLKGLV